MIRFYCPCGKRLKVQKVYAGRAVQCPHCGTHLETPRAGEEPLVLLPPSVAGAKHLGRDSGDSSSEAAPTENLDALVRELQSHACRGSGLSPHRPIDEPPKRMPLLGFVLVLTAIGLLAVLLYVLLGTVANA